MEQIRGSLTWTPNKSLVFFNSLWHFPYHFRTLLRTLLFPYFSFTSHRSYLILNIFKVAAPVAEWLRSLTSVLLIIRSSHRCGFAPRSGHESHVGQAKFCLRVCQVVFPRVLRFSPHLPVDLSRYE